MASSSLGFKHVNRGPLKLNHDLTPKDFSAFTPPPDTEAPQRTYKYQGWSEKQFEGVKEPLTGPLRFREKEQPPTKRKKVATQFVNGKPAFELDGKNFQYGTDELHHLLESSDKIPVRRSDFLKDQLGSAEERRRQKQQTEAEQDIARWRAEKARRKVEEVEEKRKDLDMLKTYQPFGRPGAGAPKPSVKKDSPPPDSQMAPMYRMTKSLETRFYPTLPEHAYLDGFGKPGGGAPYRTDSGKVKTTHKTDPSLWFNSHSKALAKELEKVERYKLDPKAAKDYKTELERLMEDKKQKMRQDHQADMEADQKMADFNPFGKPGAGAPLRDYHGQLKLKREQHLARMDDLYEQRKVAEKEKIRKEHRQKLLDELIHEDPYKPRLVGKVDGTTQCGGDEYNPWGKGHGVPTYDKDGNIRRFRRTDVYGVPEVYQSDIKKENSQGGSLDLKSTGGGGPLLDESGKVQSKVKKTMVYENGEYVAKANSAEIRREAKKDWWGKPGGGAPIVNDDGKVVRSTRGKLLTDTSGPLSEESKTMLANSKKTYFEDLQVALKEEKEKKERERRELREAGGDVAQWMKESQTGKPKRDPVTGQLLGANRIMSDVTAQKLDKRSDKGKGSLALYNDLVAQAEERRQLRLQERKREIEMERRHQLTMEKSWGREGGGAPLSQQNGGTRRSNRGQPEITPLGQRANPTQLQPPFATM